MSCLLFCAFNCTNCTAASLHSCDEAAFKSMETASTLREIISDEVV
jgi:hypothetical protein